MNTDAPPATLDYQTPAKPFHRGLHIIAWLTAIAVFPLIFMGGLVTTHGAGLAVPDWPNSFGYNMFLLPWDQWFGRTDVFLEHTHRILGSVVGLLSIMLLLAAWRTRHRALAGVILAAVVTQGVLGGLRVVLTSLNLAVVHGCIAQAVFCLTALMVLVTSRWWGTVDQQAETKRVEHYRPLARLAAIAVAIVFGQLILGAVMRHYQAGLAIPDVPLTYGGVLPPTSAADLDSINQWRATQDKLGSVTLAQVWIHFAHRLGAVVVSAVLLALIVKVFKQHKENPQLIRPALYLIALLVGQITLGVLTVLWRKPADITTAHVAVGALVLVNTFVIAARALHLRGPAPSSPAINQPFLSRQPA